jgi:hypothetical protein
MATTGMKNDIAAMNCGNKMAIHLSVFNPLNFPV